uniref:Uncharacterized protein n=1 Tax=Ipomoea trifida TaxID=35884 RepID=A0A939_IPOTF|nr:hypothetical protein [Ipomoea trifida]
MMLVRPEDVYKLPPLDDVAQCNLKMSRDDRSFYIWKVALFDLLSVEAREKIKEVTWVLLVDDHRANVVVPLLPENLGGSEVAWERGLMILRLLLR